jgi:hypothetical protein
MRALLNYLSAHRSGKKYLLATQAAYGAARSTSSQAGGEQQAGRAAFPIPHGGLDEEEA